jgi:hypothetical protein
VVQEKFLGLGGTVPPLADRGGDRMLAIIKADVDRWVEVVRKAGGVEEKQN